MVLTHTTCAGLVAWLRAQGDSVCLEEINGALEGFSEAFTRVLLGESERETVRCGGLEILVERVGEELRVILRPVKS